ncbi:UNVERIFIED_CONTAM: hypothetical protein Cloal_0850 [Acetivibrio alkalicellulosi]
MKEFNITGVCVARKHYMVDISNKINQIVELIEKEKYFTINRARQYGKTTTLLNIYNRLKEKYIVIDISFEAMGENAFASENSFIEAFINLVTRSLIHNKVEQINIDNWEKGKEDLNGFDKLSQRITQLIKNCKREIILLIDEVDKSSDNKIFLHFLGMLRNKYLEREKGLDSTFKSVVLSGVYDIKNLKIKIMPNNEKKFNSPWNIASDFKVDMSFNSFEISTMLNEYENEHKKGIDVNKISEEIYNFTSGYPFLVSKICKIIDEEIDYWTNESVLEAVKQLLTETNTLFDDLIKNLENDNDLYRILEDILISGKNYTYNIANPLINKGVIYSIFKNNTTNLQIHNKIFEIYIYNYMISKRQTSSKDKVNYETVNQFIDDFGHL